MMRGFANNFLEDEILGKAYDAKLIKRLLRYIAPYRLEVVISVLLLIIISLLHLAGPYLTKIAIDDYISQKKIEGLNIIAGIYIAILITGFVLQYLQVYMMHLTGQRVMYDLRVNIFSHLQKMSLAFFDRNPVGRLMTRVVNDVEVLNEMLTSGLVFIFSDIFTLIGIACVLVYMDWRLALILFTIIPLLFIIMALYRKKARDAYRKTRISLARLNSYLQENISGMSTVQVFGRKEKNFNRFKQINIENRDELIRSIIYNALFFPTIEVLSAMAIGLIIWYGGGEILEGIILPGVLVAFIQYVLRFFMPLRDLAEKFNIMQASMASSERIFKVIDTPEDIPNPEKPVKIEKVCGEIEFQGVWFSYDSGDSNNYVLQDISFHLKPGESIAIVGATGSGKTSIINLLGRFYDIKKGRILLDGIDIRDIDKYQLRHHIGVIQQDVFLFSGNIEENIRLNNKDITLDDIKKVSTYVNAHNFIERFRHGYQEIVQERGSTLSLGQRQLLAFARALAYNPAILILDEATSSVDTETEILIRDALQKLIKGRTSIIIAHRLSTIRYVDRIIVMKDGRIKEMGTPKELIKRKGIYYNLYRLQLFP